MILSSGHMSSLEKLSARPRVVGFPIFTSELSVVLLWKWESIAGVDGSR